MRAIRLLGLILAVCGMFSLWSSTAHAYPWMIRHAYTGCIPCHTDPSGGAGALTEYGRAQGDILLRMRYGKTSENAEADRRAGFLGGLVSLPEQLRLGGDFREAYLHVQPEKAPSVAQFITMRADLYGDIKLGPLRAAASIGYAPTGALAASLTRSPEKNVVSREHWLGVELDGEGAWLLRAGRMALPFGIRNIEHSSWTRTLTRTDINDKQQDGVALAVSKDAFRAELLAIAGNFQIRPDEFRERGYSGYAEYAPAPTVAVGVSSLFTRATRDIVYAVTNYRQAHGVFARYSPVPEVALLAEADFVYQSLTFNGHRGGYAALLQCDYEPTQGIHLMLTGESMNGGRSGEPASYDGWLSAAWFFAPHMDVRLDAIFSTIGSPPSAAAPAGHIDVTTWLAQYHIFL